jgi:hypothetical protein
MSMIDLSGITYVLPLISFVFAFVLMFAVLKKTEVLGDNGFIQALIALVLSIIFISLTNVRGFVELLTPWFVVLVIIAFFGAFLVFFFIKKPEEIFSKGFGIGALVVLGVVVIYLWFKFFHVAHNHDYLEIKDWIFCKDNAGSLWLAIVALVVGIFLVKSK